MATSSMLASSLGTSSTSRRGFNQFVPSSYVVVPCLARNANALRVRSMSEDQEKSDIEANVAIPIKNINSTPTPKPKVMEDKHPLLVPQTKILLTDAPKQKTGLNDIFAFSGPGPERINGRLAMIGFVAAIGVELASGQDLLAQVSNGGIPLFLGTSALLTAASLVPLIKGVSVESKSDGLMSSDAEIWNGRLAMLGLIALAFTEYVTGSALV